MENQDLINRKGSGEQPNVSAAELQFALEKLRSAQSLPAAIVAGLVTALLGAGTWALITVLTEYQIGWMAIGIGFAVGYTIRIVGKGIDRIYGVIGALLSLIGCAIGNLLTITYFVSASEGIPYLELLADMNLDLAIEIMTVTFDPMDILFYGIALYFGYRYAFRQITDADIARSLGKSV